MRRLVALAAIGALLTAGCSDDDAVDPDPLSETPSTTSTTTSAAPPRRLGRADRRRRPDDHAHIVQQSLGPGLGHHQVEIIDSRIGSFFFAAERVPSLYPCD